jgi:hypothetical protein
MTTKNQPNLIISTIAGRLAFFAALIASIKVLRQKSSPTLTAINSPLETTFLDFLRLFLTFKDAL